VEGLVSEETWAVPVGLAPGARIAGYVLEGEIGRGGMAVVFRARDERLDRQVALKCLAPWLAEDQEFRMRFDQESRMAAAVNNPHIIPVFRADEANGVLFIAMLYVAGGDVGSLVRGQGALPPGRAAEIAAQAASALDAAHRRGLVHRDVKPSNMLLDADGERDHVYLSDFGLAKTATGSGGMTRTGQLLGTLAYMAPEQIAGKPVDGRADQYALACAVYEMLCGEPPFTGDDVSVMAGHLNRPAPPLTSRQPRLPGGVDMVFARALAKDPAGRYPSCRGFCDALRGALSNVPPTRPIQAPPVTDPFPPPPPPPPPRRWRRAVIAAAVAAVAAVGLLIWAPWSVRSVQPPTGLKAGAATSSSVTLSWSGPGSGPAPSQYEVWQNGVAIGSVGGNADSYQVKGLDPDTTYHYQVQAIQGSDHSARSAVLVASTQTPPLSAAQIEGPWQVQFTVVTASSKDAFFTSDGKTWTVQWTFSPDCSGTGCVGTLSGYISGSNGFANATVYRSGGGYVAYANVDNIEYCDYSQYGTGYPTDDEITIQVRATKAHPDGQAWSATAWDGTFTMLSKYNQINSATWCPQYTVEADVASPAGG
jgi:serine/threonine protein kinase